MHFGQKISSSVLDRISYFATIFLLAGILLNGVALSSPVIRRQDDDVEPDDPDSDDVDELVPPGFTPDGNPLPVVELEDKYPSLDECRSKVSVDADKSVFYSRVGKHEDKPQKFADSIQGVLVREAYPAGFTDRNNAYSGYQKFMARASQAFAEKTSGIAYVLLPTDGKEDISKKVWIRIEKPALIAAEGACNRIVKVDPDDFTKQCVLWDRNGEKDPGKPDCKEENGPIPP